MRLVGFFLLGVLASASAAQAAEWKWGILQFESPENWKTLQRAEDHGSRFATFETDSDEITFYYRPENTETAEQIFGEGSRIIGQTDWSLNNRNWKIVQWLSPLRSGEYVTGFLHGNYFGISRSFSKERSEKNAQQLLATARTASRSLTDEEFIGKKFYVGFGDYLTGFMGNEVKYDIKHTHDMFTSEYGGSYLGTKINGKSVDDSDLRTEWDRVGKEMTWNDMFIQYSSGHGYEQGLAFGVDYNEIRDNALSYPAREIIVFIMACHSGGLVNSFNAKKSTWAGWNDYGRTLFVMASSTLAENSSTGPITDKDEPGGPDGSAGSAFGHALWKSLIGYADGFIDGMKDGFVSLGEIEGYSKKLTLDIGGHHPVTTGSYRPSLIMNRVPPKEVLAQLEGRGTEGLSDKAILRKIHQLEREWRVKRR